MSWNLVSVLIFAVSLPLIGAAPPMVGEKAPDFSLVTPEGKTLRLSDLVAKALLLVVLRGYSGYQYPYCNRQVQDFMEKSRGFADSDASVLHELSARVRKGRRGDSPGRVIRPV